MGVVKISVKIDHPRMRAIVGGISREALERATRVSVERAKSTILISGLVDTGELYGSITSRMLPGDPMFPKAVVGTPLPYAKYPEYGTRAHGPVRAKFLRFKPKGATAFVYAKWVRGVRPYKYMQRTLDQVRPSDFL